MSKIILGLDLGTNSLGWALFKSNDNGQPSKLIDLGVRIFQMAVEDKTPTPKNHARRNARMARRILQRRARRKQRMLNYLVSLELLPKELQGHTQPEIVLNDLGNPYELRTRALDEPLEKQELGRVLLHLVQRRGFQSNRKTLLGDMQDDPDALSVFSEEGIEENKEDTVFKKDIAALKEKMEALGCRTLGEYLHNYRKTGDVKRNRAHAGGNLRTDRQMYKDEFWAIIDAQKSHHSVLEDVAENLFEIIFFQRPLKLKKDRVGKCSLERNKTRAKKAWQAYQRFRYLQDINSIKLFDGYTNQWNPLSEEDRQKLIALFEKGAVRKRKGEEVITSNISLSDIKKTLGLGKGHEINFESAGNKKFKGNTTAIEIRNVYPAWDDLNEAQQHALETDLITYESKSALKKRLMNHWGMDNTTAVNLCVLELEPDYANVSLKAINSMLPHLEAGALYSSKHKGEATGALQLAGYEEEKPDESVDRLGAPPEIPNPIVSKGLHEVKRVVNAIIKEYGKPDYIRVEMARDLEMNTKRYKTFRAQQNRNTKLNDEAQEKWEDVRKQNTHLQLSKYASRNDKIKYRLWLEQDCRCAYSGKQISQTELFSAAVEVDHILPYSLTLNDSYMNKVVCFAAENQVKRQKTPVEAFGGDEQKWAQIEQAIDRWYGTSLRGKRDAFYQTSDNLDKDFINSQLNDTRYISREALDYLKTLGSDVSVVKGQVTSWLRHIWGLNSLFDVNKAQKDRSDHRHHAIDAAVIACTDRRLYQSMVKISKELEMQQSEMTMNKIHLDPLYEDFKAEVHARLESIIIAHAPQRKITGALHEDTGIGYLEGKGAVYRKNVDEGLTANAIKNIVDPVVKAQIEAHLEQYDGNAKIAFAKDKEVLHTDGRTPIKRVRVIQSKTTREKLDAEKLAIKNQEGKTFKWMTLGNTHHVEIFKHKEKDKYTPRFVTALEATQRAQSKQLIVNKKLDENHEFCFALHKNDLVTLETEQGLRTYRVQKLEAPNGVVLRLHTAAKIDKKEEGVRKSVNALINENKMCLISINSIGKVINDKTDNRS